MTCHIPTHVPCPHCPGEIIQGRTVPVVIRARDAAGNELPADPATGELPITTLRLPYHVADVPCSRAAWDPDA